MESFVSECGQYRIDSLSAATFPGALNVLRKAYFPDEALCIGTEVNKNPLAVEELLQLCADTALDGVSLVAVETNTGEVVSVCFNKLQVLPDSTVEKSFVEVFAEEKCTQPSSRALVQFMVDFDDHCNFLEIYGIDCGLEIAFLGTLHEHRNRKLGFLLFEKSIELAKKLKDGPVSHITPQDLGPEYTHMKPRKVITKYPKICQVLCTSMVTQKMIRKLNFIVHVSLPLKEFVYDGKNYAERIGSDPHCEGAAILL